MADAFLYVEILLYTPSTWDTALSLLSKSRTGWPVSPRFLNLSPVADCVYRISGNLVIHSGSTVVFLFMRL